MNKIISAITSLLLLAGLCEAAELNFSNGYELFRSAYSGFPEAENETRSSGTLDRSRYMATTHIKVQDRSNEEIQTLFDSIRLALIDQFEGSDYEVHGSGPTGKNGVYDKFDIIAGNKEFQLFLAVDYTPSKIITTLVHIPKG